MIRLTAPSNQAINYIETIAIRGNVECYCRGSLHSMYNTEVSLVALSDKARVCFRKLSPRLYVRGRGKATAMLIIQVFCHSLKFLELSVNC